MVFERSKRQRFFFSQRFGQRAEDSNKIPSKDGLLSNPLEEPDGCSVRRTETYRAKVVADPVISNERSSCSMVTSEVFFLGGLTAFSAAEVAKR